MIASTLSRIFGLGGPALFLACLATPYSAPAATSAAATDYDALARCVWEKVPTSASNWLQLGKLKRGRSYSDDSKGFALQFRLAAACNHRDTVEAFALQQALLAARPAAVGPDLVEPRATRCEMFFEDDAPMARVAGVNWAFGDDADASPRSSRTMFGVNSADFNALMTGKKIKEALQRIEQINSSGVRTYAEGQARGGPFVLARDAGLRRCKVVQADGSMTDA
jgi:hypothetical protein